MATDTTTALCLFEQHTVNNPTRLNYDGYVLPVHCPTCSRAHREAADVLHAAREAGQHYTQTSGRWTKCRDCGLRVGAGVDISDYPCRLVPGMVRRTVTTTSKKCSERCVTATRNICECRCAGLNHGGA